MSLCVCPDTEYVYLDNFTSHTSPARISVCPPIIHLSPHLCPCMSSVPLNCGLLEEMSLFIRDEFGKDTKKEIEHVEM